jgi:hypothetical protein
MVATDDRGNEVLRRPIYGAGACGAGCNMAFRRSAFGTTPFDTALGTGTPAQGGEDLAALIDVLWRGGRIGFEPAAVVRHEHRREYRELQRQMSGYGCGFTAMLAALVLHDPRHLGGLAAQLPPALGRLVRAALRRLAGRGLGEAGEVPSFPGELARRELLGYLRGPGAYLAARREMRRWAS